MPTHLLARALARTSLRRVLIDVDELASMEYGCTVTIRFDLKVSSMALITTTDLDTVLMGMIVDIILMHTDMAMVLMAMVIILITTQVDIHTTEIKIKVV